MLISYNQWQNDGNMKMIYLILKTFRLSNIDMIAYFEIITHICLALLLVKLLDVMYNSAYIICSNY